MSKTKAELLPPPPPPTVSLSDVQRIEQLVSQLRKNMHETNIRVRFKMCVYQDWCSKIDNIDDELKKLRAT